jgi:hypothetical protein
LYKEQPGRDFHIFAAEPSRILLQYGKTAQESLQISRIYQLTAKADLKIKNMKYIQTSSSARQKKLLENHHPFLRKRIKKFSGSLLIFQILKVY